jgi:ubiquinone biosynthesis protein
LDWLSHSNSPWRFLALPKKWVKSRPERTQPVRVRMALEELGTTYIKLGQAISTRTDLLPKEYVDELSKLQDAAPSIPYEQIRDVVREELGEPPEMVFREFCHEPEAAASIGQVHRARLPDGTPVMVKVERPGSVQKVEEDLLVLHDVASFLTANTTVGKQYDFLGWLDEFAYTIRNELDFRREGRNADRIRENFLSDPDLHVPRIHWKYTTRRVITMEQVCGLKLSDTDALDAAGIDRQQLSRTCARIVLTMVFRHGFFHADPHPGNFFVLANGSIGLVDLGMVGRLDQGTRESLMRMTLAVSRSDGESLLDELLVLGVPRGPIRRQDLRLELDKIVQTYTEGPPSDFSLAHMLNDILAAAARHAIHMPSDLLFLAKTIAMCEGLSTTLDPHFNLMSFTRSFLEQYGSELREPKVITERVKEGAVELADLALHLPKKARRLFGQLERGEVAFTTRLENADQLLDHVHIAANRLAMSVIMASLIVGMSYVVTRQESRGTTSILLQIMLALAVIGGIALLVSIWRSKRH